MASPLSLESALNKKRTAVKLSGFALLALSFQTLGIIYSDIGTSPLYVLNGIWSSSDPPPSKEDVLGGVSAIVWALTLAPLIKYVFISLYFGTQEGEGGSYALYQGLYPPDDYDGNLDRTLTGDSYKLASSDREVHKTAASDGLHGLRVIPPTRTRTRTRTRGYGFWRVRVRVSAPIPAGDPCRSLLASHKPAATSERFRIPLLAWGLFGTALTIADGAFTPAVSVTSAVGGIAVAKASVTEQIVPSSIVILLVLFIAQRFGTSGLAFLFAPIACIWFLLLAGTGIYNITSYPGIFRAFDPSRAVMLFVRTGDYDILAGVLLAVTGCEAIFANLGQFNATSIRMSFGGFVYPSLVLAYLGQGARLIHDGDAVISNIFYKTIPGPANGPLFWIVFVFAILATVIASQAMITATFSLVQQLVNMKALPSLKMEYTSETIQGQVYIPVVNWTVMVVTIIIVAAFANLAALTNAYGFCVATVMFSTTILLAVQMRWVKHWPVVVALGYFIFYGFIDGLFWGASLKKVPRGAWVPLMIGAILMTLMSFWTWAKGLEDKFDGKNRLNLRNFIHLDPDSVGEEEDEEEGEEEATKAGSMHRHRKSRDSKYYYTLEHDEKEEKHSLAMLPTCAVFHKIARGQGVPHTFVGFIRQWPALPRVVIFLSVSVVPIARVPREERYAITKVRTVAGFYGVTAYLGFREHFDIRVGDIIEEICALELQMDPRQLSGTVEEIRKAALSTTHIAPHYHVISKRIHVGRLTFALNWIRKYLIEDIYRRLSTIFPETGNWLFAEEIIRVGISAEI